MLLSDCCEDKVDASECCGALMVSDYDICPECLEHTGIIEECDCEDSEITEKELPNKKLSSLVQSLHT